MTRIAIPQAVAAPPPLQRWRRHDSSGVYLLTFVHQVNQRHES
jgi:hypothetical protein